jgi:transketolase
MQSKQNLKYKMNQKTLIDKLTKKSKWVRKETLLIHKIAPGTRIASSMSLVEILVTLFYGNLLKFKSNDTKWEKRDRLIISKGHGAISMYPILSDLGFFSKKELSKVCTNNSLLGGIPDSNIPGFESTNGSLGHGLGYACGIALALKKKKSNNNVFVIMSDGELCEGAVWEAFMFAGKHKLNNLIVILDNNKTAMLDYTKNILDFSKLNNTLNNFSWKTKTINGHKINDILESVSYFKKDKTKKPKFINANTLKGKNITFLENKKLSHIMTLNKEQVDKAIENHS